VFILKPLLILGSYLFENNIRFTSR